MVFKKGNIPWIKGRTKENDEKVRIIGESISKIKKERGKSTWNKGLTKDTSEILKKSGEKSSKTKKGKPTWNKGLKGVQTAWNKGIPQSPEAKEKNKKAHEGIKDSIETRKKKSKTRKGKHFVFSDSHKENLSISKKEYFKNNPDKIIKGKDHHWYGKTGRNFGKQTPHPKKIFPHLTPLQGLILFHRWDRRLAMYYDTNKISYYYEHKTFPLILNNKPTTYTPDFYNPSLDLYIEVKGYWRDDAEEKFNKFKETYPKIKIQLLHMKDLNNLGINLKNTKEENQILSNYEKQKELKTNKSLIRSK